MSEIPQPAAQGAPGRPLPPASLLCVANAERQSTESIDVVRPPEPALRALRCGAALVDRSERGKLALTGSAAAECLTGQVTADVLAIEPGHGSYSAFLTTKGQMLGDMRIVRTADTYELDTERISLQAMFDMLRMALVGHDAELHKRTLQRGLLSLIGPKAHAIAEVDDLGDREHRNAPFTIDGVPAHAIVTDRGIDVLCASEHTGSITQTLLSRGAVQAGEDAFELARIERGRPRFGVEMGERTMPQEAGLTERAVSFTKGCYTGQETVARLFYRGKPNRAMRGLRFEAEPSGDGTVNGDNGKPLGRVARVADSPRHGLIALALLRLEAEPGTTVTCGGATATVVDLPWPKSPVNTG